MTYAFNNGPTITTWGRDRWRARWSAEEFVEFDAPRDSEPIDLLRWANEARAK